ncbi:methylated-DNA--[protein]-cysteine S-methyltransferase [Radicibacter daui]|uniref:methylated-DNA--[protein]-cysteine S-methyltransferase n=1 Tax=Radicibacter daui TaxID=3064829 RepID=UPI004046AD13
MMEEIWGSFTTPVGTAVAWVTPDGSLTRFWTNARSLPKGGRRDDGAIAHVKTEVDEYFAGARKDFTLPLAADGTPFQKQVWAELCRIPFGETISYLTLATRVGDPGAARAVGHANGRNPIGLIVPCHRVIGANGTLTGYAGGLPLKQALLEFESGQPSLFPFTSLS